MAKRLKSTVTDPLPCTGTDLGSAES